MHSKRSFFALAALLAGGIGTGLAQTPAATSAPPHHAASASGAPAKTSPYSKHSHSAQSDLYYTTTWGIEKLQVRKTSSGSLLRFSYRVVDPVKAKVLQEKKAEPHMIGLRSHAVLSVPALENVGQLRQTEGIQADKDYWVLFSNKGELVKVGDRVDVAIGDFYATGLTVE